MVLRRRCAGTDTGSSRARVIDGGSSESSGPDSEISSYLSDHALEITPHHPNLAKALSTRLTHLLRWSGCVLPSQEWNILSRILRGSRQIMRPPQTSTFFAIADQSASQIASLLNVFGPCCANIFNTSRSN